MSISHKAKPENQRLRRLLAKTVHVAPYHKFNFRDGDARFTDAYMVFRAWMAGKMESVPRRILERLAHDRYGHVSPYEFRRR